MRGGGFGPEDHQTWRILFEHQIAALAGRCRPEYLAAVEAIGLRRDRVPSLTEVDEALEPLAGWRLVEVAGSVRSAEFFALIAEKRFPVSGVMRPRKEIWHASMPDIFHDVFGHVPLLANPLYGEFLMRIGSVALRYLDRPPALRGLAQAIAWTVEYGLMGEVEDPRVDGAALISSATELDHALGPVPRRYPFEAAAVATTPHVPGQLHEEYFVAAAFDDLLASVDDLALVAEALAGRRALARGRQPSA